KGDQLLCRGRRQAEGVGGGVPTALRRGGGQSDPPGAVGGGRENALYPRRQGHPGGGGCPGVRGCRPHGQISGGPTAAEGRSLSPAWLLQVSSLPPRRYCSFK